MFDPAMIGVLCQRKLRDPLYRPLHSDDTKIYIKIASPHRFDGGLPKGLSGRGEGEFRSAPMGITT